MKVIITGATGMIGKAVLLECLEHQQVTEILLINRKSLALTHPKLKEIIHKDFADFSSLKSHLNGYDACFYCMGISVVGHNEESYSKITFNYTKNLADLLFELNPKIIFNYVSGVGTDSSESGKTMWARVKGKTENYIFDKGFQDVYAFRLGAVLPEKGVKSNTSWYNFLYVITRPLFPIIRKMDSVTTSRNVGLAMINSVLHPQDVKILENQDVNQLAKK